MKKSTVIASIMFFLISVCLCGCTQTNTDNQPQDLSSKFLGNWEYIRSALDYETWSFYTNGSAKNIINTDYDGQMLTSEVWYDYIIDNSTVCFSTKNEPVGSPNYVSMCFTFNFSDQYTHLTLSSNSIIIIDLEKIS
jgi:hypothetical protein